jgi:hypothetical protein
MRSLCIRQRSKGWDFLLGLALETRTESFLHFLPTPFKIVERIWAQVFDHCHPRASLGGQLTQPAPERVCTQVFNRNCPEQASPNHTLILADRLEIARICIESENVTCRRVGALGEMIREIRFAFGAQ